MRLPPDIEERVMPKFEWIRLLENAGAKSLLYAHDDRCRRRCERPDRKRDSVSHLQAATIAHVGVTLAHVADVDGSHAWMGLKLLAERTKRHKVTVIAALAHLEAKELLYARQRGGTSGIPRTWATTYALIRPPEKVLVDMGLLLPEAYEFFAKSASGGQ